jgi:ribonuclease E
MTKKMLIDATHPEETRVAVVDGTRLEEFDFEIAARRQIKSNIYLAKVTRVEPSLQAAFVEYGGNRHGFLPFPEIHPDYYRIPVGDRPIFAEAEEETTPRRAKGEKRRREHRAEEHAPENPGGDFVPFPAEADASDAPADDAEPAAEATASEFEPEAEAPAPYEDAPYEDAPYEDTPYDDAPPATMAEATAADPVVSEVVFDDAPVMESVDDPIAHPAYADDTAYQTNDPAEGELAAELNGEGSVELVNGETVSEEPTVDVVGGDEVEDAQRRRRVQLPRYKIQEVIKRRQIMLVQVSKEERGNKGAAVTTYLSLPGRYCVLMPNTSRGGGVSRKIANPTDRKRMKELISDLEVPEGMSVILRTAGVERSKAEIKRDLEYLLRLWENIRTLTLQSTAPALIYEEGNLVKRAIRDLYTRDIDSIEIAGEDGYRQAKDFMRMLMPSHAKRVQPYRDPSIPLFFRYQVESQIDLIHNPVVHLKSGGYIVINQTEALVSIDVNSGRSTRERNIEETALKTNSEAAEEIARQLRLRDLGGLIVIDFIDMDEPRHDAQVERRLKEAMKNDRARIQVGRISPFGLLELSRQRLHPSLIETNFHTCAHCLGTGLVRSTESAALLVLRAVEEEGVKRRSAELAVTVSADIALYILNQKRSKLIDIEQRYGFSVRIMADNSLIPPEHRIERLKLKPPGAEPPPSLSQSEIMAAELDRDEDIEEEEAEEAQEAKSEARSGEDGDRKRKRRRNRRRRGRDQHETGAQASQAEFGEEEEAAGEEGAEPIATDGEAVPEAEVEIGADVEVGAETEAEAAGEAGGEPQGDDGRRRRRGRRGGRGRTRRADAENGELVVEADAEGWSEPEPVSETEATLQEPAPAEAESVAELQPPAEPMAEIVAEPVPEPEPEPAEEPPPRPVAREFETVNQPPPEPKRGFWKRLVR